MMAAVVKTSAQSRVGWSDLGQSCCKVAPWNQSSMSLSVARQGSREMTLVQDALVSSGILTDMREEAQRTPPNGRPHSRLQSTLCTFQI